MTITGIVFNIQRFSIHDGPGIRTTVFLKGCPLQCFWCHNPEGLKLKPEVQFFPQRCILCGECVAICQQDAHSIAVAEPGTAPLHTYDRERCIRCGECIEACCAEAVQFAGKETTVEAVVAEALRDRAFYETSNGGVTLSGGEPMLQPDFTRAILQACKAEGVHTAIETSAHCSWELLQKVLPVTDLIMMDIKHLDSEKHRWATGVPNHRILENAQKLAQTGMPIIFRIPVIPTVNDTPEEVSAIAAFVAACRANNPRVSLELLPFHRLAGDKYASLGFDYRANDLKTPPKEQMAAFLAVAKQHLAEVISR